MKFLFILLLFIFSCDDDDNPIITGTFSVNFYNTYTENAIMIFSKPLDLNQFDVVSWLYSPGLSFECDSSSPSCPESGYGILDADTTNIYKIANPAIFGVECHLIYDDNYKTLTEYITTTLDAPEGTGVGCSPLYLDNIMSVDNQHLSDDLNIALYDGSIKVVPNPYIEYYHFGYLRFTNLPTSVIINILDGNQETVISITHNSEYIDGDELWFLQDEFDNPVGSGIYFYEVIDSEGDNNELILNGSFVMILNSISE